MTMQLRNPIKALGVLLLTALALSSLFAWAEFASQDEDLLVLPYLQIGPHPDADGQSTLRLSWHAPDRDQDFRVEVKTGDSFLPADKPSYRTIDLPPLRRHRIYQTTLRGLTPGKSFSYRLINGGAVACQASGRAIKPKGLAHRFVVFGDLGFDSPEQRQIAFQTHRLDPDFVLLTGDIVYMHGRLSEYRKKFFPIYNADLPSPQTGAPLLRRLPFVAAPGNHDTGTTGNVPVRDLDRFADGLAYFILFNQPLNGMRGDATGANRPLILGANKERQARFASAAAGNYPVMANFSFDWGDAHYLILDGNDYMDWTDEKWRSWVESDLRAAAGARWKFVAFHQPPFSSDRKAHFQEQRMRLLCDIFQRCGVDVVFSGHVHNYQRTCPLKFSVREQAGGPLPGDRGEVAGTFALDRNFDGIKERQAQGVIYLISGGGGAGLSGIRDSRDRSVWQPFTKSFIADTHSLTVCDVDGTTLTVRQVAADGRTLDSFTIEKAPANDPPRP